MKKVFMLVLVDENKPGFFSPIHCYSSLCVANQAKNRCVELFGSLGLEYKVVSFNVFDNSEL